MSTDVANGPVDTQPNTNATTWPPQRSRWPAARRKQLAIRITFMLPAAAFLALIFAYPLVYSLWLSFRDYGLPSLISGTSEFIGLSNFKVVLSDPNFTHAIVNTVIFTVVSMTIQYVIGMALALFFHSRFPLSGLLRAILILPWLIPAIVSTTAFRFLFQDPNGFLNQLLHLVGIPPAPWITSSHLALTSITIVNIWIGIAFNLILLFSGMQEVPLDRYESAEIDGASYWQRFRYITFPALRPITAVILILGFVYTLKQFDLVWTLTQGGPGNASQLLSTWAYTLAFQNNEYGKGAAASDVLFVICLITIFVYVRIQRKAADA